MKKNRTEKTVIRSNHLSSWDESNGESQDIILQILGAKPANIDGTLNLLKASLINTPLGPMIAIANESALYLLDFVDRKILKHEVECIRSKTKSVIIPGNTPIIDLLKTELDEYFKGNLLSFTTPIHLFGSEFQKSVWRELQKIKHGATKSYLDIAKSIGKPTAFRAAANANGANRLAVIIPCHRVINSDGRLGGYGGGVTRKRWLLNHERSECTNY